MKTSLCVVALALLSTVGVGEDDEVNQKWLAMDRQVVNRVRATVPPNKITAAEFIKRLQGSDVRENRDIGFGARRMRIVLYGGHMSAWVRLLIVDKKIAALRIHFDEGGAVGDLLLKQWNKKAERQKNGSFVYRYNNKKLLARIRAAATKTLGKASPEQPEKDLDKVLLRHWRTLTDPMKVYDFGWLCYEDGSAPAGAAAIEALLAAKRLDLVRAVLRSPNPEGRVFAVHALLAAKKKGAKLAKEDKKAIAFVRESLVPISCCSGCLVSTTTAKKALADAAR